MRIFERNATLKFTAAQLSNKAKPIKKERHMARRGLLVPHTHTHQSESGPNVAQGDNNSSTRIIFFKTNLTLLLTLFNVYLFQVSAAVELGTYIVGTISVTLEDYLCHLHQDTLVIALKCALQHWSLSRKNWWLERNSSDSPASTHPCNACIATRPATRRCAPRAACTISPIQTKIASGQKIHLRDVDLHLANPVHGMSSKWHLVKISSPQNSIENSSCK
jgi:hypothetical protein